MMFRFRDWFWAIFTLMSLVGLWLWVFSGIEEYRLKADEINRDDSSRVLTTLLREDQWAEFQISSNAQSLRLMTNGGLKSTEWPGENQTDPRSGWRYSIEYQLLDQAGTILDQSVYHLRAGIRELIDSETGELINPLVFGKDSWVATQTRFIQLPLSTDQRRPDRIRIRTQQMDPQLAEIVVRVRARHQRPYYDRRSTWKQTSTRTREKLARYCVFDQKFLTHAERASLLRWQWVKAPPLGTAPRRHLYFLGDVDDQEVPREAPTPGTHLDPGWRSTLPLPNTKGKLRLEFERVDKTTTNLIFLSGKWFDGTDDVPRQLQWKMNDDFVTADVDYCGGIFEFESSSPVSLRSYWKNLEKLPADSRLINAAGQPLAINEEIEFTNSAFNVPLRVYLVGDTGVQFPISHIDDQPTPFRLSMRLGYGNAFLSDDDVEKRANELRQPTGWNNVRSMKWEYLDAQERVIDNGVIDMIPKLSAYDRLWKQDKPFAVSEKETVYFSIPAGVASIRLTSEPPFLINASVRPWNAPWVSRIPEDQQPFERKNRTTRKWFGLKPNGHHEFIAGNRSFVLSTQSRTGIIDEDADPEEAIDLDNSLWQRYEPDGQWIGRQILVPAESDRTVTQNAMFTWFNEVTPNRWQTLRCYNFASRDDYRLIFITSPPSSDSGQRMSNTQGASDFGELTVFQDGRVVQQESLVSSRGQIRLNLKRVNDTSKIKILCDDKTRLFFTGGAIDDAPRYLKRTACRLDDGQLNFQYSKTSEDAETLTLSVFRQEHTDLRCEIEVEITSQTGLRLKRTGPVEHLTSLRRIYDVQAQPQRDSLLIGSDAVLDVEHKCFIQLGPDLPPGKYHIKVRRLDGNRRGFVLLHRLHPRPLQERQSR